MKKLFPILFLFILPFSCIQTKRGAILAKPIEIPFIFETELKSTQSVRQNSAEMNDRRQEQFSPQDIIQSYKTAYPDRIEEISFKNDDWAIRVYDRWFYWADGRFLPEELIYKKNDYSSHPFYNYPEELPTFVELPQETKDRLDTMLEKRKTNPLVRQPDFLNSLWRIYDKETSWARVKTTYFLGYKLQIHRDLLEDLANVEEEIQRRMLVDSELNQFVRSLKRVDGYNWRQIAETETLSVHSYGIALDLILSSYTQKEIYWLWAKNKGLVWYDLPYEKRFSPPLSFIRSFEKYGFIWGGKWLFFDTIHFEYRPEILILNGLLLKSEDR